mmetsp:Transcript_480/g.1274  ORF Transcript_480/g.1274 Transcript_480/m.1274 type:complete len:99 (-) Transcript_480:200-496(-)
MVESTTSRRCHASVAAIWETKDDPLTVAYVGQIERMHKVVLEVKDQADLEKVAAKLTTAGIVYHLWIEQPEGYPTCLATKPYLKEDAPSALKRLRLCT